MLNKAKMSQILRRAGFEASKQTTTAVRGWYNFSRGYVVEACDDAGKVVRVSQRSNSHSDFATAASIADVALYASALIALGFDVQFREFNNVIDAHTLYVSEYATEA
jgi:hypothetical protein